MKSVTILQLAEAMIGDRPIEIKIVGTRPGERKHEILVSEEEAQRTRLFGHYLVIDACLPEVVRTSARPPQGVLESSYTSADSLVSLEETRAILGELCQFDDDKAPTSRPTRQAA